MHTSVDELWLEALAMVLDRPLQASRAGETREVLGYSARLSDPTTNFTYNPARKFSPFYAPAELLWYLSGDRRTEMIEAYAPSYARFADQLHVDDNFEEPWNDSVATKPMKIAHGAYGHRMARTSIAGYTFLAHVIRILRKDPDSRQAVLALWANEDDLPHAEVKDRKDIPCTLSIQFLLRDGALNCFVTMRSNDAWLGMPNDIFCFTGLQLLVAEALGAKVGFYQHNVGSFHLYERDREKAVLAANPKAFSVPSTPFQWGSTPGIKTVNVSECITQAVRLEEHNRRCKCCATVVDDWLGKSSFLRDIVIMAATKWSPRAAARISNPSIRQYTEAFYDHH